MKRCLLVLTAALGAATAFGQGWIEVSNETSTRLIADPNVGVSDPVEKDYAWADLDQDGDIDLVVARKSIGSTTGAFRNVLFMNEGVNEGHAINGVLVDRTQALASATDVAGDNGMMTPTNDRDVTIADIDNDGWLDVITAPTYSSSSPKHVSHPRIYRNLGEQGGVWQGLRFENFRIPQLQISPNFCHVAAGDLDDDGDADLYFVDYNNSLEDRLLINLGNAQGGQMGVFRDETAQRTFTDMISSAFANATKIADMNGDGYNEIVKNSSLGPYRTTVSFNNPLLPGFFTPQNFVIVYTGSPYFVNVTDLNKDDRLDLLMVDDNVDRYAINEGNGPNGNASFTTYTMPGSSSGFGGNITVADLNKDGLDDVITSDVDVDLVSSGGSLKIYRNRGAPINSLFDQPAIKGMSTQNGTFDVAAFDINGDTWDDLVVGKWTGTQVFIQAPPFVPCPGDLDGDGDVDLGDLGILLSGFGVTADGDLDGDNDTDLGDLGILLSNFGQSC